jgi:hypothetical protein
MRPPALVVVRHQPPVQLQHGDCLADKLQQQSVRQVGLLGAAEAVHGDEVQDGDARGCGRCLRRLWAKMGDNVQRSAAPGLMAFRAGVRIAWQRLQGVVYDLDRGGIEGGQRGFDDLAGHALR